MLFLDELTQYPESLLEALRQPLEDGCIRIVRLSREYVYPADFMLAAAINATTPVFIQCIIGGSSL